MGVRFLEIAEADREFIASLSSGYLQAEFEKGSYLD
jgi:hypothetical protein